MGPVLNCGSVMTRKPPGGMVVAAGRRYFFGVKKSSEIHQSLTSAVLVELFHSSMKSTAGVSLFASTSLTSTGAKMAGAGSFVPGEPPSTPLGRQLAFIPHVSHAAFSFTMTSERPSPSVIGYQVLL